MTKIVAKMWRMKMLSEVRKFVEGLPFQIAEKQTDDSVYSGTGSVDTGSVKHRASVKIAKNEFGKMSVFVKLGSISDEFPFETEASREKAAKDVQKLLLKLYN